jgi:hypothetical protein
MTQTMKESNDYGYDHGKRRLLAFVKEEAAGKAA